LLPLFAAGDVDTGVNLPLGVIDTGGKFAAGIVDTSGKFANLPPVSTTPAVDTDGAP
jgi:hypothetical protein